MEEPTDVETDAEELVARAHRDDRVLGLGALRALSHPIRVQIYDILSQYGPQTASTLAERLGESSGSTSYHLRALAKHDLIREVAGRGSGRERWWERPIGGVTFLNEDAIKTPAGRAVTQLAMREFFRNRSDQLREFTEHGIERESEDWRDASLISTASANLTAAQTRELSRKIMALVDETVRAHRHQAGEGVRPVTMRVDVFPLPGLD
ncbi:MAG: ArsR/SmtB family transcription factor [Microbacterium sp.]|uniref:ArsR/SmtB family transcription factor n=1 Tax=Microbacterium sp. TaxID=51671 RepID=UPI003A84A8E1